MDLLPRSRRPGTAGLDPANVCPDAVAPDRALSDFSHVGLAIELIRLGARMQVLSAEVPLSRDRLARLFRELRGEASPKGQLPFSSDWFLSWRPNAHASLFMAIHGFVTRQTEVSGIHAVITSFRLYREQLRCHPDGFALSFTRAWLLVRFVEARMLDLAECPRCGGVYLTPGYTPDTGRPCGFCAPPPRMRAGQADHAVARRPASAGARRAESRRRVIA